MRGPAPAWPMMRSGPGAVNEPCSSSPKTEARQPARSDRGRLLGVFAGDGEDAGAKRSLRVEDHGGRLAARAHAELAERRGEMTLDSALGEEEPGADLAVGEAHDDHPEDLLLPEGERRLRDARSQRAGSRGRAAEHTGAGGCRGGLD